MSALRLPLALAITVGGLAIASTLAPPQSAPSCPPAQQLARGLDGAMAHVRYLADDALEGRATASPGERCAGDYIAARFRALGLSPAGERASYFQPFPVRVGARLGPGNTLTLADRTYTPGADWIPYGFSARGQADAPALYGEYGITRPGEPEDVYSRADLHGKIVVVEAGDPNSPDGRSLYADPHFKARVAAERGAAALIVLLRPDHPLPDPTTELRPSAGIPALAARGAAADAIRDAARRGASIRLHTAIEPRMEQARNVAAVLPGTDPRLRGRIIVIGAHYDHLGRGGEGSLAPDATGTIHNGADDNASGTAAMLEIARRLATGPQRPGHSTLFLAFSGEERGLLGSAHYVSHPTVPLDSVIAMLNLDMVGRLRDDRLTVMGVGTAKEWRAIIEQANARLPRPFTLALTDDGFGPSDHSSFYARGIPVLHLFTNAHEDYHRPTDDWDRLNAEGLERVLSFVTEIVRSLAPYPQLTAIAQAGDPHARGEAPAAPGPSYGPYLGTIPDFSPVDFGVRITGVREGSPAAQAGLKPNDVIVAFDGKEIPDIYAYTYALRARTPGDTVHITVLRDGKRLTVTAVLGARR